MQLECSKDMSVHVSACTRYNLNTLMVLMVLIKVCVFLCLITKVSNQFLEQQINIKFCVNLGKNAK